MIYICVVGMLHVKQWFCILTYKGIVKLLLIEVFRFDDRDHTMISLMMIIFTILMEVWSKVKLLKTDNVCHAFYFIKRQTFHTFLY